MKKLFLLTVILTISTQIFAQRDLEKGVMGNSIFAFEVYQQLAQQRGAGNLFISPYSISSALSMTYAGARGETEAQMSRILHLPPRDISKKIFLQLSDSLEERNRTEGIDLQVANAVWMQRGQAVKDDYLTLTEDYYNAGLKVVDFKNQIENSRKEINEWVALQTNRRIENLIAPGILAPTTRFVLTNAIYFNAQWRYQFKEEDTREMPFYVNDTETVNAQFMNKTLSLRHYRDRELQAVEIPYSGNQLTMIVLLPGVRNGLAEMERNMTYEKFQRIYNALALEEELILALPKFTMESELELAEELKAMGLTEPFAQGADFSGITGGMELNISDVIHKTFINVNEQGTEAAAATAVVLREKAVAVPMKFTADHPFMFLIVDASTQAILFMGRVTEPIAPE